MFVSHIRSLTYYGPLLRLHISFAYIFFPLVALYLHTSFSDIHPVTHNQFNILFMLNYLSVELLFKCFLPYYFLLYLFDCNVKLFNSNSSLKCQIACILLSSPLVVIQILLPHMSMVLQISYRILTLSSLQNKKNYKYTEFIKFFY